MKEDNGKFYRDKFFMEIDKRFDDLAGEIDSIKNNHLPHIQSRLDSIEKKMAWYAGAIAFAVFVVEYIIKFYK